MRDVTSVSSQRGVITIFISMLMLILITVLVVTAYSLSTTNLRAVGNVQVREEALAAAQDYIEQVVASPFVNDPNSAAVDDVPIDINADGNADYLVDLAVPVCVRATQANIQLASSVTLPGMTATSAWDTIWELDATATEATSGVSVNVAQGVRVLLNDVEKNLVCP